LVAENITALNGTYYIGVYGYSYATFNLLVRVHRKNDKGDLKSISTPLYEGFSVSKRLHNELDSFFGYFVVDIAEKDDISIIINMQCSEGRTKLFVSYGKMP